MKKSAVRLRAGMAASDAARAVLPRDAKRFFLSGRKALRKGDTESLHQFRISAKRFRYALEIFEPLYGPQFAQRLKELKKLQDLLGRLNDLVTVRELTRNQPELMLLSDFLDREERDVRKRLEKYWTDDLDAQDNHRRWIRYLTYSAGAAGRRGTKRPAPAQ